MIAADETFPRTPPRPHYGLLEELYRLLEEHREYTYKTRIPFPGYSHEAILAVYQCCEIDIDRKGHLGEVHSVVTLPDGKHVVFGGDDGTIQLWNFKTGKIWKVIKTGHDPVETLELSHDDSRFAAYIFHPIIGDLKEGTLHHLNEIYANPLCMLDNETILAIRAEEILLLTLDE